MKSSITIFIFLLFPIIANGQSTTIALLNEGDSIENLIPINWKLLSSATGDLNDDGYNDLAFVVENTDEKFMMPNDVGLGRDTINMNPRILGIYLRNASGKLIKKLQSDSLIILQDSPTMDEPFRGIEILENGDLKVNFHFWYSAGSWSMSSHRYIFKYQNLRFDLIGYNSEERHRGTGETTDCKIDFLTKSMTVWRTTIDEDDKETVKKETQYFELDKLKCIQSLGTPFKWEINGFYL